MALATVAGALACTLFFLFIISGAFLMLAPNPPRPEIRYGEFPIRVIFELDGETKVIEDTVIAEFAGIENRGKGGRFRVWTSHLKSGNERLVLLRVENEEEIFEIFTTPWSSRQLMGDLRDGERMLTNVWYIRYLGFIRWENGEITANHSLRNDEVWEKYNLRIIEAQLSPHIENRFGWRRFIPRWFLQLRS